MACCGIGRDDMTHHLWNAALELVSRMIVVTLLHISI